MKLVSLNVWGGGFLYDALINFVRRHAESTDFFCFQEMTNAADSRPQAKSAESINLFEDLEHLLPNHRGLMAVCQEGWHWRPQPGGRTGNALFVKNTLPIADYGEFFVVGEKNSLKFEEGLAGNWSSMPRVLQFVQIAQPKLTIFNYHGYWHLSGKGDLPERLAQSDKVLALTEKFDGKKILCGDFNVDMPTKSIDILESRLRNLVREYGIITTRHPDHYPKHKDMPYADYTFVSGDIDVISFAVPQEPVSDHLPMILEFE